jgi:transcriptional regulator with XRE-family HTH domain
MKDRLLKFLEEESLTAGKFADEIGVQRSSISHILSGRNNPGYDFFQKILKRYPHLNAEWLITGSGKMTKTPQQASLFNLDSEVENETHPIPDKLTNSESVKSTIEPASLPADSRLPGGVIFEEQPAKKIEKVVILYTDRSFKEYLPSK